MATSNFYQDGNHGLNVILIDNEDENDTTVEDTLVNIVEQLSSKGYSVDDAKQLTQAPRSFETGQGFLVYNKKGKIVAFYELCAGYYSGANINVYTGDELIAISDDGYDTENEVTKNKIDIKRVVAVIQENTEGFRRVATFSNGESIYERGQ